MCQLSGCPRFTPPAAGKYVTGDINEAYLRNLEESGRGKRRARPGRKTSLVPTSEGSADRRATPAAA